MAGSLLASLAAAGVVERAGPRRAVLRVTTRFLAHAEGTAGRLRTLGRVDDRATVLEVALATWDGYHNAAHGGARILADLLGDREQFGNVFPVFAAMDGHIVAA